MSNYTQKVGYILRTPPLISTCFKDGNYTQKVGGQINTKHPTNLT